MSTLQDFLTHDIEGYLVHDLRAMQQVAAPQGAPGGGLGYPLLMTTLAGIELLGAILSSRRFDKKSGDVYFADYWKRFLYPATTPQPEINVVYQLARHGIAHNFLLKGPLGVVKGQPASHLKHTAGRFLIDASQLAEDLITSYETRVKPFLAAPTADVDPIRMSSRLSEMSADYQQQAQSYLSAVASPTYAGPPLPAGSGPSGPIGNVTPGSAAGPLGPLGPVSSDVSKSGLP